MDTRRRAMVLLAAGYALLLIGWLFGNPPFAAPDEVDHYLRAVEVGGFELIGDKATFPPGHMEEPNLDWVNQATRLVEVPAGLYSPGLTCNAAQATVSAACQREVEPSTQTVDIITPVGTYEPLPYFLPGVAARFADDPLIADYVGRAVSAVPVWMLLVFALAVAGWNPDRRGLWPVGSIVAVTPMVVYVGSYLSPSGLEVTAGLAFAAVMVRLGLGDTIPGWMWIGGGIAGAAMALSRSIAPLWIALLVLVPITLRGVRGWGAMLKRSAPPSVVAATVVVGAVVTNRIWEYAYGPHITVDLSPLGPSLAVAVGQYSWVIRQQIGMFGYLEALMPNSAYLLWFGLLTALLGLAFLVATRRERIVLVALSAAAVAVPALLLAAVLRHTGFGVQGRHVLAFTVSVPLLAGAVLARRADRLAGVLPPSLPIWVATGAALVHVTGWLANARRHAVGSDGPLFFLGRSEWAPPLGWFPWLALIGIGSACIVAAAWTLVHGGTGAPERDPISVVEE